MNIGKLTRLNRIFADPSGRLCSIAVDHFMIYAEGLPSGLRHIQTTLAAIVAAKPDAVTMHKGMATSAWVPYAGQVPLILQSVICRPDDTAYQQVATPEEAVRLGPTPLQLWLSYGAKQRPCTCGAYPIKCARQLALSCR